MAENKTFSISRKGYNCAEVENYISSAEASANELRASYASLQEKYDSLFEENGNLIKEREQLRQSCKTMAVALKQLRDTPTDDYKAKYEETAAELEKLRAERNEKITLVSESSSATQMIEEVAQVVKRVESDARRKAEALTAAAKLEQTQAQLISARVTEEVKSLIQMLEGFLEGHEKTE